MSFRQNFACIVASTVALLGALGTAEAAEDPGIKYAPWVPGDALFYINQNDEAWTPCMNRAGCPQLYIYEGPVKRISDYVVQTPSGTFLCRVDQIASLNYPSADCIKEGWLLKQCPQKPSLPMFGSNAITCVSGGYGKGGY